MFRPESDNCYKVGSRRVNLEPLRIGFDMAFWGLFGYMVVLGITQNSDLAFTTTVGAGAGAVIIGVRRKLAGR